MRGILFRGRDMKGKAWHYGYLDATTNKDTFVIHAEGVLPCEVQPDTVGMDTGLTDKNGTQIFEGDIVAHNDKPFGIVIWHTNGCFCINDSFDMKERDYTPIGKFFELCYIREHKNTFSVIGNIHDNPEMINQLKTK